MAELKFWLARALLIALITWPIVALTFSVILVSETTNKRAQFWAAATPWRNIGGFTPWGLRVRRWFAAYSLVVFGGLAVALLATAVS